MLQELLPRTLVVTDEGVTGCLTGAGWDHILLWILQDQDYLGSPARVGLSTVQLLTLGGSMENTARSPGWCISGLPGSSVAVATC